MGRVIDTESGADYIAPTVSSGGIGIGNSSPSIGIVGGSGSTSGVGGVDLSGNDIGSYIAANQLGAISPTAIVAMPLVAAGSTVYGTVALTAKSIKDFITPSQDILNAVNIAKNPLGYVNSLIPEPLHDIYNSIDSFVNKYLPAPLSTSDKSPTSNFNSPSQVYSVKEKNMALIAVVSLATILSIAVLIKKGRK